MASRLLGAFPAIIIDISKMHDTTLMAESEEELKSLLMKLKEENEKVCLMLSI